MALLPTIFGGPVKPILPGGIFVTAIILAIATMFAVIVLAIVFIIKALGIRRKNSVIINQDVISGRMDTGKPKVAAPSLTIYLMGLSLDSLYIALLMGGGLFLVSYSNPLFWDNQAMHSAARTAMFILLIFRLAPRLVWQTTLGDKTLRAAKYSILQKPIFLLADIMVLLLLYVASI